MSIVEQFIREYGWSKAYATEVREQYIKFLALRNTDEKYSPTDDIDRFWHQHILNTAHYQSYCIKNFGRIVHHRPTDAYDREARAARVANTVTTLGLTPPAANMPSMFMIYTDPSQERQQRNENEKKMRAQGYFPVTHAPKLIPSNTDVNATVDTRIYQDDKFLLTVLKGQPLVATIAKSNKVNGHGMWHLSCERQGHYSLSVTDLSAMC